MTRPITDHRLVADAAALLDDRPVELARVRVVAAIELFVALCHEHDRALARVRDAAVRLGPCASADVGVADGVLYIAGRPHVAPNPRQAVAEALAAALARHHHQEDTE